jgi:hypothetical protein
VISISKLRKKSIAAVLLAFMASAMLPACSSDEEEAADTGPTKDEICDEVDAGTQDCSG